MKVITTAKLITIIRDGDKKLIIPEGSKLYAQQCKDPRYFGRMCYSVLSAVGGGGAFLDEPVSAKEFSNIMTVALFDNSKMELHQEEVYPRPGSWPEIELTLHEKIAFLSASCQRYDSEGLGADPICVLLDEYVRRVRQVIHYPRDEQFPSFYRQLMKEALPELWAKRPFFRNRNTGCWWPAYTKRGNRKRAALCLSLWSKLNAERETMEKPVKMNDW